MASVSYCNFLDDLVFSLENESPVERISPYENPCDYDMSLVPRVITVEKVASKSMASKTRLKRKNNPAATYKEIRAIVTDKLNSKQMAVRNEPLPVHPVSASVLC